MMGMRLPTAGKHHDGVVTSCQVAASLDELMQASTPSLNGPLREHHNEDDTKVTTSETHPPITSHDEDKPVRATCGLDEVEDSDQSQVGGVHEQSPSEPAASTDNTQDPGDSAIDNLVENSSKNMPSCFDPESAHYDEAQVSSVLGDRPSYADPNSDAFDQGNANEWYAWKLDPNFMNFSGDYPTTLETELDATLSLPSPLSEDQDAESALLSFNQSDDGITATSTCHHHDTTEDHVDQDDIIAHEDHEIDFEAQVDIPVTENAQDISELDILDPDDSLDEKRTTSYPHVYIAVDDDDRDSIITTDDDSSEFEFFDDHDNPQEAIMNDFIQNNGTAGTHDEEDGWLAPVTVALLLALPNSLPKSVQKAPSIPALPDSEASSFSAFVEEVFSPVLMAVRTAKESLRGRNAKSHVSTVEEQIDGIPDPASTTCLPDFPRATSSFIVPAQQWLDEQRVIFDKDSLPAALKERPLPEIDDMKEPPELETETQDGGNAYGAPLEAPSKEATKSPSSSQENVAFSSIYPGHESQSNYSLFNIYGNHDRATYEARNLFLGHASLEDYVEILDFDKKGNAQKVHIIEAFATLSAEEKTIMGVAVHHSTFAKDLTSPIMHRRVKLGNTSLHALLDQIVFDLDDETSISELVRAFRVLSATQRIGPSAKMLAFLQLQTAE